jgi:hypothetical protein
MSKLNVARRLESGNIVTPKGRMLYPALFRPVLPVNEKDEEKAKYQVTLLIPAGADTDAMKAAYRELVAENIPEAKRKTTKVKSPFLETADQPRFADMAEDFPVMIRCQAKFKPDVVTPKGDRTISEDEEADEVYGGRWARLSVRPYFWKHPTGGCGVSFGLQNVQLLDHDEPIAGGRVKGVDEFEPADNGLEDLE